MTEYSFHAEVPNIDALAIDDRVLVYDKSQASARYVTGSQVQSDVVTIGTSSTSGTIVGWGTATLASTAASAYTLAAPVAGQIQNIVQTTSSTVVRTVTGTTVGGATFVDSTKTALTFTTQGQAVILKGISATQWAILSNVGSVTSA